VTAEAIGFRIRITFCQGILHISVQKQMYYMYEFFKHTVFIKIGSKCFYKGNKIDLNIHCICENYGNPKYCTLCLLNRSLAACE